MRALIVEDDGPLQAFLMACLGDMGHETVAVGTVAQALSVLQQTKFDLLIVDYSLPDGPSVPVMDFFGAMCPNSRSILLTGSGIYPNGEVAFFAPGVDWVLRKPVELQDLQALIEYAESDARRAPRLQAGR